MWGQYYEQGRKGGEAPTLPEAQELVQLYEAWRAADTSAERERAWHAMLAIHAEQVFTIGIVTRALQPLVVRNNLRNVPTEGIWNWDPGAYFGIYRPDTFWIDAEAQP
jgi:peptide/nickel transport system substrate-binding protein